MAEETVSSVCGVALCLGLFKARPLADGTDLETSSLVVLCGGVVDDTQTGTRSVRVPGYCILVVVTRAANSSATLRFQGPPLNPAAARKLAVTVSPSGSERGE